MGSLLWRLSNDQSSIYCEFVTEGDGANQVRVRNADDILAAVGITSIEQVFGTSQRLKRVFMDKGFREEPDLP